MIWAGKLVSILVLCYAGWLCRQTSTEKMTDSHKIAAITVFLLLSCCISPVSWMSAYVLAAPALVVCCVRLQEGRTTFVEAVLALLLLPSFITGRFVRLATETGKPIFYYLPMMTPVLAAALALAMLRRFRKERIAEDAQGDVIPSQV
jgi:uncharacterized membrane protein